ncbi:MAG: hypothetical protein NT029_22460 [Armatimonadetes bacterium]|nr:hypothetical protein [Armatimonadota bacterium]
MTSDETLVSASENTVPAPQVDETPAKPKRVRAASTRRKAPGKAVAEAVAVEAVPAPVVKPEPTAVNPVLVEIAPAQAPAKPKRAPSPRKRPVPAVPLDDASEAAAPPTVEEVVSAAIEAVAAPEAPAEPAEAPAKPKRSRSTASRSRKPKQVAEASAEPEVDAPAAETLVPETLVPEAEAPAAEEAPVVDPVIDAPEAEAEAAPTETAEAVGETPAPPKRSRRSRRGRGGSNNTEAVESQEAIEPAAAEAPVVAIQQAEKPKRSRGGRRKPATEEAEPTEPVAPGARVVVRKGLPELMLDGKPLAPALFFGDVSSEKRERRVTSEIERASKAGVPIVSALVELTCPMPPDDSVYEMVDARLSVLAQASPTARIMPRIVFLPAPVWKQQYPGDMAVYDAGTSEEPSIASDTYWMEAEHALRALVTHIERTQYGRRVIGYHLERGEWFQPAEAGYDRSFANREAFRRWLRTKYGGSEVALRSAWFSGSVQFYTAEIPAPRTEKRADLAFYESRRERQRVDFHEFTSDLTATRLIGLARAAKEASGGKSLVSVCYGYTYEFTHSGSGHLALGKLLSSSFIDAVAGPPSYKDRLPGAAGACPWPVDSPAVHGKLAILEDDTKTHLAPAGGDADDFNPRMDSRHATESAHMRSIGIGLAHQVGLGWMDLWGDGWLDSEDAWERAGRHVSAYAGQLAGRKRVAPDVVAMIDESSLFHLQNQDVARRILHGQREALARSGASVAYCLQSDVLLKSFPDDAKLFIFLSPFRMPAAQRVAVRERLQKAGKVVVWVYAAGICDAHGDPEDGARDVVGMTLRRQAWGSEMGSKIVARDHPIGQEVRDGQFGVRERLNPSFYVDDLGPGMTVVGEYSGSGLPSLVVRDVDGWKSVFYGETALTAEVVRGLCRLAGVPLATANADDYVSSGNNWLSIHAVKEGVRSLSVPAGMGLYDLQERTFHTAANGIVRVSMRARSTRVFAVGSSASIQALGLKVVQETVQPAARPVDEAPVEAAPLLGPPPALPGPPPALPGPPASLPVSQPVPAPPPALPGPPPPLPAPPELPGPPPILEKRRRTSPKVDLMPRLEVEPPADDADDADADAEALEPLGDEDGGAEPGESGADAAPHRRRRRGGRSRRRRSRTGAEGDGAPPAAEGAGAEG